MRYKQVYYESLHIQTILIDKITVFTSAASLTAGNNATPEMPACSGNQFSYPTNMAFVILILKPHSSFIYSCTRPEKSTGDHAGHKQGHNQASYGGGLKE